jgi:hypothetical protein
MKKLLLIVGMVLLSFRAVSPVYSPPAILIPFAMPINPYQMLWEATCIVESGNDPLAYNVSEIAIGISQIRPIRVLDYFQRTGRAYSMQDMYDVDISRQIYMYYAHKYNPNDLESIAKAWNGRGKGNQQYWNKIKLHL